MEKTGEWKQEQAHLLNCLEMIEKNIAQYEQAVREYDIETKDLYRAVQAGETGLYNQLVASRNIQEHMENSLRKNRAALHKAYFGRIDYRDETFDLEESLYIGKNGISRDQTEVVIVDWRAPVASVYYENGPGKGTYLVPEAGEVEIDLKLKRTYDLEGRVLIGYYEDDVAANDELLVKYLAQNKEAVLGDIIATIQKDQNQIIRDTPFKNIIVQGVAGSGKTTVALHRISYLLYNYDKRYKPSEFCIVGSSDMLLDYIASGLPELDVKNVKQMRMDAFLTYLMEKAFKKKYRLVAEGTEAARKSKLFFIKKLEAFLTRKTEEALNIKDIKDQELGVLMRAEDLEETKRNSGVLSLFQLEELYNRRLASRIRFLMTGEEQDRKKKEKLAQYRHYFHSKDKKETEPGVYLEFLNTLEQETRGDFSETIEQVKKNRFDIYDIAALALIWKRIFVKKQRDEFSQIFIDEAQDFGETVYYVLHCVLPECYFTIMGDVSQNIRYETGMNDWEGLKEALFEKERDSLYLLLKSYRNTIEISREAGKVLREAADRAYQIEPVIRHGKAVEYLQRPEEKLILKLRELLKDLSDRQYQTIAVITRTEEEAEELKTVLSMENQNTTFSNGIMILPIALTKGLEFDAVIIWKPDEAHYGKNPKEAKLLYVAITRALHELYFLGDRERSPLLL